MFDKKLKALSAQKGKKAEDLTSEEIKAMNAELTEAGIVSVMVSARGSAITQETVDTAVSKAKGTLEVEHQTAIDAKDEEIQKQAETITANDTKIKALEASAKGEPNLPKEKDAAQDRTDAAGETLDDKYAKSFVEQAKVEKEGVKKYNLNN